MCGRFALTNTGKLARRFQTDNRYANLKDRYNIAPSQIVPIVVRREKNLLEPMKWGLIPFWAKDPAIGNQMINARAETLWEKPSFRKPLKTQRCLVPASGFYEWKKTTEGKQPCFIRFKDRDIFAFAGLYDRWKNPQNQEVESFTIITTAPNRLLSSIHHRMPVILKKEDETTWLEEKTDLQVLQSLLVPYENENALEVYPVSLRVNSPEYDDSQATSPLRQTND